MKNKVLSIVTAEEHSQIHQGCSQSEQIRLAKLGEATEKGLARIENSIPCKGIYRSEPCKETNTFTLGCALRYFCESRNRYRTNEDQELKQAIEVLEAFNRAGISYRVCEDGSFVFHSTADLERASEISQEIQRRY